MIFSKVDLQRSFSCPLWGTMTDIHPFTYHSNPILQFMATHGRQIDLDKADLKNALKDRNLEVNFKKFNWILDPI